MNLSDRHYRIADEREEVYRFLSGLCLQPPSEEIVSVIKDRSILSLFDGDSRAYKEMEEFIEEALQASDLSREMEAEHTVLFVLPGAFIPHEAVYLDKDKKLGGRVTIEVEQFYKKAGARVTDECLEMPDHIGMELEFMAFLCSIESGSWKNGDAYALRKCVEYQKRFMEQHMLKWSFQFCEKLIERTRMGFYRAVAYMIMDFLRNEEEYITELYSEVCNDTETSSAQSLEETCETSA